MNTKEILTIIALVALGLCLLCCLTKAVMKKGDKGTKHCDKACGAFVFLAIVLMAVSQLLGETEKYSSIPMSSKFGYCTMKNANTPLCGDLPTFKAQPYSYQCTKASGDYGIATCRKVNKPPSQLSGRYTTRFECQTYCRSHPPPVCYPTPSHGAIDPYITTLNTCNLDKDCNVNGYFSYSDAPTCSKCSNGKCGVYGHINGDKKKYI